MALYELCNAHYEGVYHNTPIVDGWDADIILPNEQTAILWNGRWHREQLTFKNHSLSQVQTRDRIKKEVLERAGWTVLVFEDNEFTPESAFVFLKNRILACGAPGRS